MAEGGSSQSDVKGVLKKLEATLQNCSQQLNEDLPQRENLELDLNRFWNQFTDATKLVSHEATKLCMAFEGEGLSSKEQTECLVNKIEKSCVSLLCVFLTLPKEKGKLFYKEIHGYVSDVIQAMGRLCTAIINDSTSQLHSVGDVWELCEAVQKLPRDNRDAVFALCREQYEMVSDASEELMETLSIEDDSQAFQLSFVTPLNGLQIPSVQNWTDSDRNVLLPSSGLVKACKACIKKTMLALTERGDGHNEGAINELDILAETVSNCSSLADDFVLSLYPPMDHSLAREQAAQLRRNTKKILELVKNSHFASPADETWIEYLEKAVDHNWVRISDMVLAD